MRVNFFARAFFMLGFCLPNSAACASQWTDRVKGALIGSVIGDALGRVTERLSTASYIKKRYGESGITSISQINPCDWMYEPFKSKAAAYSSNTVMAMLTYKATLAGRKKKYTDEKIAQDIAQRIVAVFGTEKFVIDHHFSFRHHTAYTLKSADLLAGCLERNQRVLKKNCLHQDNPALQDNESSALARAWPIGLIFGDSERAHSFSAHQTRLTHEHPTVVAASAALAVGTAASLRGESPDLVVSQMLAAAMQYEQAEQEFKSGAKKLESDELTANHRAQDAMYTSDMIRYAEKSQNVLPDEMFANIVDLQDNNRSERGYLRGSHADEAIAAAVYIFLRHPDDLQAAIAEAANAGGRTALIASLVGALVGARCGFEKISEVYGTEVDMLESIQSLNDAADEFTQIKDFGLAGQPGWSLAKRLAVGGVLVGALGLAGYYALWL